MAYATAPGKAARVESEMRLAPDRSTIMGVLLAGGEGVRFGGRKAMAVFAGAPMIAAVARALAPGVHAMAVVGDGEAAAAIDAAALADPDGVARGPLAGVLAGLEWAQRVGAQWIVTAPCDTPLLPENIVSRLAAAASDADAPVALARTAEGVHPLCGLWRVTLREPVRAALVDGAHPSVQGLARALGGVEATFADAARFMNVNTQDDLARAEAWRD